MFADPLTLAKVHIPACKRTFASSMALAGSTSNDSSLLAQHNETIKRLKFPDVSDLKSSSKFLRYTKNKYTFSMNTRGIHYEDSKMSIQDSKNSLAS